MNKECDASTMTFMSDYLTTTIKVAHITTAYQSIITILDSLLRQLDFFSGIHLTVISAPPTTVYSRKPACRHISIQMCRSISPASDLKSIYHLYQLFRTERFDIVHSHTAKAGIIGLTKAVAKELGRASVNVNAVAPGMILTDMMADLPDDVKQKAIDETVLARLGTPEECASVIAFLCAEESRHITGEVIKIDGGQYI